jgi:hypothetical protein
VDSHADLRLAALTQLYNVVVDAPLQFRVLLRTLAYAKAANLAGVLAPVVKARSPACGALRPATGVLASALQPTSGVMPGRGLVQACRPCALLLAGCTTPGAACWAAAQGVPARLQRAWRGWVVQAAS